MTALVKVGKHIFNPDNITHIERYDGDATVIYFITTDGDYSQISIRIDLSRKQVLKELKRQGVRISWWEVNKHEEKSYL